MRRDVRTPAGGADRSMMWGIEAAPWTIQTSPQSERASADPSARGATARMAANPSASSAATASERPR